MAPAQKAPIARRASRLPKLVSSIRSLMGIDPAMLPDHFQSNRGVRPELGSSVKRNARTTLPAPSVWSNPLVRENGRRVLEKCEEMLWGERLIKDNRQGCEKRRWFRRRKNRRNGNRLAMPGSEKRNNAKMGGGGVRMQLLMQGW